MADKAWKVAERKVAEFLGGERNPLSGSVSRHTAGDVIHRLLFVEVKYRAQFAVVTLARETRRKALAEGKVPVVVLKEKNAKTRYYVIREQDLPAVCAVVAKQERKRERDADTQ